MNSCRLMSMIYTSIDTISLFHLISSYTEGFEFPITASAPALCGFADNEIISIGLGPVIVDMAISAEKMLYGWNSTRKPAHVFLNCFVPGIPTYDFGIIDKMRSLFIPFF